MPYTTFTALYEVVVDYGRRGDFAAAHTLITSEGARFPDIVILRVGQGMITPSRIVGAPDLVIEIASPSTAGYDRREKQDAYAAAGVGEYWIVDPHAHTVEVLRIDQTTSRSLGIFRGQAQVPSTVIPPLPVAVAQFFDSMLPG